MESSWSLPEDLYSSQSIRGTYSPLQLVVRLDPKLRNALKVHETGFYRVGELAPEVTLAFSTYFHETIHWWQHVGSTTGLLLSLAHPAESHVNRSHLLDLLKVIGGVKSLRKLALEHSDRVVPEIKASLNITLHNCHDVLFNSLIMLEPERLDQIVHDPFFESIGHSIEVGLGNALWMLISTFDHETEFLPDIRRWEDHFEDLRLNKVEGFYWGSPITRLPIGGRQILEGQARFCQIQYLYLVHGGAMTWDDFAEQGMMGDLYSSAFKHFLQWTGYDWPKTPVDPVVQMFLLVCDLSINPSDGYPFDLFHYESLIQSVDPAWRFVLFCQTIAQDRKLCDLLSELGRNTYLTVSGILCSAIACKTPVENAIEIVRWSRESSHLKELMEEESTFRFKDENLPVRLYFAKHIRFAEDRIKNPEFFCWPAMHFVQNPAFAFDHKQSLDYWDKHSPLFVADFGDEVRPVLAEGRSEEDVYHTFNRFYMWNAIYGLVRQWVFNSGPFKYDYKWLAPKYSEEELKTWVSSAFRHSYGISTDEFDVL